MREEITQEILKSQFQYDPETGIFMRTKAYHTRHLGVAGGLDAGGYVIIRVRGLMCKAHRLAWLYMTGRWPENEIDHIDKDKSNNRWCNLRDVSHSENMKNQKTPKNRDVQKGYFKKGRKFVARIVVGGRCYRIGAFETSELASEAYQLVRSLI